MKVGSLFSGIGGMDLGLEMAGMEIIWQCEVDPYASAVLRKHWPNVPNFGDITSIDAATLPAVDLICGGYPCQPFSVAGRRQGARDDRHLWPVMRDVVAAVRPTWVLCENVAGHITMGLDRVLSDLEALGYACQPLVIPACAVDAPHRRDRVWILAHSDGMSSQVGRDDKTDETENGTRGGNTRRSRTNDRRFVRTKKDGLLAHAYGSTSQTRDGFACGITPGIDSASYFSTDVSESGGERLEESKQEALRRERGREERRATAEFCRWLPELGVGRVAHGIPRRVDRLKCLGNAVVPQVAYEIGRAIMAAQYGEAA